MSVEDDIAWIKTELGNLRVWVGGHWIIVSGIIGFVGGFILGHSVFH